MTFDVTTVLILFFAGILVGFINTIAGSGSLISLPLLIFFGLDASVANGTNRIAVLMQNITGIATFRKQKLLHFPTAFKLSIPVITGAIAGSYVATIIDAELLEKMEK